MHLIREGQFSVADCFVTEAGPIDIPPELQQEFQEMYEILDAMRTCHDLSPAIRWAHQKSVQLEQRGSNLEFELCKLQFIWLFIELPDRAMAYARQEFSRFQEKHLKDIQQLMCAFLFLQSPEKSPYSRIFADPEKSWNDVAHSFTKEFCSLLGLSAESPLYIAATAGAIALPTLLKMASIMKEKKTEWSTVNELPVKDPRFLTPSLTRDTDPYGKNRLKSRSHRDTSSTPSLYARYLKTRLPTAILQ